MRRPVGVKYSRARWVRRQRTPDGEDRSAIVPPGRKKAVALALFLYPERVPFTQEASKPLLGPPFHPHSLCEPFLGSVQVGCSRFSRRCHLIIDLTFHYQDGSWARR